MKKVGGRGNIAALVGKLKSIREPRMRRFAAAELLARDPPDAVVAVLAAVIDGVATYATSDYTAALEALTSCLAAGDLVPYEVRASLYGAAKRAGREEIARLFFDASPATVSDREREASLAPERPVVPKGRPITLGERKSLARGHRRQVLEHLLRDPHPDVVAILIENPHVTERDIVALAARRPSSPEALTHIAACDRWVPRYQVKLALVRNPHTPVHIAVRQVTMLRAGDLRAVAADRNLAAPVREQADLILAARERDTAAPAEA